jgi:hypothetical protein
MCSPGDCRGEDGNRYLITKVVRRSGERASKSFLAAFVLGANVSDSTRRITPLRSRDVVN